VYEIRFHATIGADWSEAIEVIDANTNERLNISSFNFVLGVQDECNRQVLKVSTEAGTINTPETGVFTWLIPASEISGLEENKTYRVGCRFTDDNLNNIQLFIGSLAVIDGEVS